MGEWQPIETAPKDHRILMTDGELVGSGCWEGWPVEGFIFHTSNDDERWFGGDATHWMPLPEPPQVKHDD